MEYAPPYAPPIDMPVNGDRSDRHLISPWALDKASLPLLLLLLSLSHLHGVSAVC